MVALMKLPGFQVSPLLDLAPINEGLAAVSRRNQLDKQNERADKQMAMQEKAFTAQQQDRMRKLIAGRAQMIMDEPDDAKAAALFQRHFASPEIQAAIKENGLDPADFRGVAKAFHAEALGPVDPLERAKTQAQIESARASTAASQGAESRAAALHPLQRAELERKADPNLGYKTRAEAAAAHGMQPGTREYNEFVLTGDFPKGQTSPALQFAEREAAAKQFGLQPGSPAYQAYVLTGKMPREDQQPLTPTDKKAILEADEAVLTGREGIKSLDRATELSRKAYYGPGASIAGTVTGLIGNERGQATTELSNTVTENALRSLKAIFGGNPTEGERRILLDIQGSVNMPPDVREKIYARAREAAQRRLEFMDQRAKALRSQDYYKPQGQPGQAPANDLKAKYGLE